MSTIITDCFAANWFVLRTIYSYLGNNSQNTDSLLHRTPVAYYVDFQIVHAGNARQV